MCQGWLLTSGPQGTCVPLNKVLSTLARDRLEMCKSLSYYVEMFKMHAFNVLIKMATSVCQIRPTRDFTVRSDSNFKPSSVSFTREFPLTLPFKGKNWSSDCKKMGHLLWLCPDLTGRACDRHCMHEARWRTMQKSEAFEVWAYRIVLLLMVLVSWSGPRAKDKQMYAREYE